MVKLTVTISHLEEYRDGLVTGSSVKFRVWQENALLVEDTIMGKASAPFHKVYNVDAGHDEIRTEHNRPDLPWLNVQAVLS